VNIDGVFDFDMRGMNRAGLVLRARGVGSQAAFVGGRGDGMGAHKAGLLLIRSDDVATRVMSLSKRFYQG